VSSSTADDLQVHPSGSTRFGGEQAARRSERIKLRRGMTYLGMTLLLPGSAQLAAGHQRVGRLALRAWVVLWGLVALTVVLGLLWRDAAIELLTYGPTLRVVQVVLVLLGVGWGLLLVDAWRISRPPELARQHRLGFALLNAAVVAAVVGGMVASASLVSSQRDLMATVFAGGGNATASNGRYNILLLGADAGKGRVGLRPDSLTVASVDAATGRTVLFSLPRNLEDVPFPDYSPLHQRFPQGYSCRDHSCMLNAVYTYGHEHPDLYPGVKDPGAQATAEAVEGATGLKINYYVLVDLKGFEALVDAVGGIRMDISKRVPIGGGPKHPIYGYVEAGQNVHLDGYHALWFARSRSGDSDYARIVRQKCVMSAMLNQLDPLTVLTKFNRIAAAGKEIMETNIPTADLNTLMGLALEAKELPLSSLAFVPPLIRPGDPDFEVVRSKVQSKIDAAEAADAKALAKARGRSYTPTAAPTSAPPQAGSSPSSSSSTSSSSSSKAAAKASRSAEAEAEAKASASAAAGEETDDLDQVCSAR
jgi:LCP family protein required for cell wall assembly